MAEPARLTSESRWHILRSLDRESAARAAAEGASPKNSQAKGPLKGRRAMQMAERSTNAQGKAHCRRQYLGAARRCNAAMRVCWTLEGDQLWRAARWAHRRGRRS